MTKANETIETTTSSNNRRRKRRSAKGASNHARNDRASGDKRRRNRRRRNRYQPERVTEPVRDDAQSILGGRTPQKRLHESEDGPPDGFSLFSSYYLGVTADDGYKEPGMAHTSKRFGISPEEVEALLSEHQLDKQTMASSEFDLEGARLDVRLAPEGISRTEIARDFYESYIGGLGDGGS